MNNKQYHVTKRNGIQEVVSFDRITERLFLLTSGEISDEIVLEPLNNVNYIDISMNTIKQLRNGISTTELDNISSQVAMDRATLDPEYGRLASRICVSNLHKNTKDSIYEVSQILKNQKNDDNEPLEILSKRYLDVVERWKNQIENEIRYERDYLLDFFGLSTLIKSYLLRLNDVVIERPQQMWMRVSIQIHLLHKDNLNDFDFDDCFETYHRMSKLEFVHATPTLFNSGTKEATLASCILMGIEKDSISGIFESLMKSAILGKGAAGIGMNFSRVRADGSMIKSSQRPSKGVIPFLKIFNSTSETVDQARRRKFSIACNLEVWHGDVFNFVDIKKNTGPEELRARNLFHSIYLNDLFFERVMEDGMWSLMCPDKCPGLIESHGDVFKERYLRYESEKRFICQVKANDLFNHLLDSMIKTGGPYLVNKDAVNLKCNQKNLGTIQTSNLCTEITIFSNEEEFGVCVLGSIALPKCVENDKFNFEKLGEIVRILTRNLNKVIDCSFYSLEECKRSSLNHRPIGIGIQGLADTFLALSLPFASDGARELNLEISECIYYHALDESCILAKRHGKYSSFDTSPMAQGIFQFDMWGESPKELERWEILRDKIKTHGLRNSLLVALMPTAGTSQILGNCESFDPLYNNIYNRYTLAGNFTIVNNYLIKDLTNLGLWNSQMKDLLIAHNGSVQNLEIPTDLKEKYRTVWEISPKVLIDYAADRGRFTCQTQSMNIYLEKPDMSRLGKAILYGWKKGLKTLCYYLRSRPASDSLKFSIDANLEKEAKKSKDLIELPICNMEGGCLSCSS